MEKQQLTGASADADQALAVPVEPASGLDPSGFDPSRCSVCSDGVALEQPQGPSFCTDHCPGHSYEYQGAGEWICAVCGDPRPDDWADGYEDYLQGIER